jgi:hypothetical protein
MCTVRTNAGKAVCALRIMAVACKQLRLVNAPFFCSNHHSPVSAHVPNYYSSSARLCSIRQQLAALKVWQQRRCNKQRHRTWPAAAAAADRRQQLTAVKVWQQCRCNKQRHRACVTAARYLRKQQHRGSLDMLLHLQGGLCEFCAALDHIAGSILHKIQVCISSRP